MDKRISQLRAMGATRENISSKILDHNKQIIEHIWEETLKKYIVDYLSEKNFSQNDLKALNEKLHFIANKIPDKDAPIIQMLYQTIIHNILLPDYEASDKKIFKELDEILERTDKKIVNIMRRRDDSGFFSIRTRNFEDIYEDFTCFGDIEPKYLYIWWIFGMALIENNDNSEFSMTIPVRIQEKSKVGKESTEDDTGMAEWKIQEIIKRYTLGKNSHKIYYEEVNGHTISIETSRKVDKNMNYGLNEKDVYIVVKIFQKDTPLSDDMEENEMKDFVDSILWVWEKLINEIAIESGVEHKKKVYNFDSGFYFWSSWEESESLGSKLSTQDLEKFKALRVDMKEKVSLSDIGWQDEAVEEITKIIQSIKYDHIMKSWWAKPTTGVILEGPAGTGKTLLAKAIASEIDADVYNLKLTDIASDAYINTGANAIKNFFIFIREQSKKHKKIVVILDELDALFSKRGWSNHSGEDTKIVNTFLTEFSGFEEMNNVIFVGTTNLIENIDEAILRAGRMSTHLKIDKPNKKWIQQMFEIHLNKAKKRSEKFRKAMENFTIEEYLPNDIENLSGADIEEIVRILTEMKWLEEITTGSSTMVTKGDIQKAIQSRKIKKHISRPIGFVSSK